MYTRLTIRQRILLTFILIAVSGGVVQFIIAGRQLQLATLEFYQHHLETDALLVAATFSEPLGHYLEGEGSDDIGRSLSRLQSEVEHDYLIVDTAYRVIGYSANTGYEQIEHVPETPELVEAKADGIGADIRPKENGEDTLYLAVTVNYEGSVLGYLVLSEPMQPAYSEVNQRYLGLAGATLPVIGLVAAASLWISGTISRPIRHLSDSALRMAQGALDTRIPTTAQDEIGQLAESFNFMAAHLETLMKTQRSFVSNAAHELRTPLMTLKLRAEALEDETLSPDERTIYLTEIRQEIDHMAALVSSLLLLARIDEGRQVQKRVVTDPASMLQDVTRHWRIEVENKGLQFIAQIAPDLPDLPISSSDLRLVIDNLLANAVKYTAQGSVRLDVFVQKDMFTLAVADTGGGFTPEQGTHLFERFYRSEQVRGKIAGTGLGLAVVKALLDEYGGSIEAMSLGPERGAIFTVQLKLAASA